MGLVFTLQHIIQLGLVYKISYKYLQNITYMFCEVLLYSREKEFYKREGKSNVKRATKKMENGAERQKIGKETGEGNLSGCSVNVFHYIYSYIWYIMDLDVDIGKLPNHLKLCVLYLALFYHPTVSNGLRFIVLWGLMRFHYNVKKSHLQYLIKEALIV